MARVPNKGLLEEAVSLLQIDQLPTRSFKDMLQKLSAKRLKLATLIFVSCRPSNFVALVFNFLVSLITMITNVFQNSVTMSNYFACSDNFSASNANIHKLSQPCLELLRFVKSNLRRCRSLGLHHDSVLEQSVTRIRMKHLCRRTHSCL